MESIHKDIEFLMKPNTKLGLEYIQKQKLEISGYEFDKNYPNFNSLQSEYNNLLKVIDELIKDRRVLKDFLKNMDNFITQYESTFNVKLQREIF